MDEETRARIVALERETEALKKAVEYLLWARASPLEGDARAEAVGYQEMFWKACAEAKDRRP